ncbi:phage major capsid protein [Mesorhizobium sp. B2-1-3A]|nr:phage major capsid protein [Mesorhizobium sp. B2-1-3A]
MMCAPVLNQRARGLVAIRNDGGNATAILNELKQTFEAFKDANNTELANLKKGLGDVVQTEQVDRINAEITKLQKALDDTNVMLAAIKIGGAAGDIDPDAAEHALAFNKWFRKGVDNGLSDLEVKAKLTTQSDPDGGYLVPEETETTIDRILGTVSVLRSLSRVISISTDTYKKLVSMGGASSGWVGEEDDRPNTDTPTLREIVINVGEIYANPYATQTMLDDSRIDIAAWLGDEVSIEFAEQEGAAFISGNGKKKPRGILTYQNVPNASYAWGKIGYVATGQAATFETPSASVSPADCMIDLYYALKSGYRNGASWLMSDAVMGTVRKWKDADGAYIWSPPAASADVATILQKPVYTDDNMPAIAANTFPVAFGNFNRGYLIADRFGIRVLRDPYTKKPYVQFYTTKRVGGGVVNFEAIKLLKVASS